MLTILVYFPSDRGVDYVVNNQTNHKFTCIIVLHVTARVCWIIRRTIFNVNVCLNHSCRYEHNQFEKRDGKPRHQRQSFQNLDNILYLSVFRK